MMLSLGSTLPRACSWRALAPGATIFLLLLFLDILLLTHTSTASPSLKPLASSSSSSSPSSPSPRLSPSNIQPLQPHGDLPLDKRQLLMPPYTSTTTSKTPTATLSTTVRSSSANTEIPITSPAIPALPTVMPRPTQKPALLTDFEYETMWDPDMDTLRLGVLLSLNANPRQRESIMVRKAISAIRMAVNDVNEQQIIPGINMSIIVRDSQDPSLYTTTGGSAAISGAGKLISAKVGGVIGDIRSDLTRYEALMTSSVQIPQCSFASANTILSDSNTYPYFYRTIPTTIILLDAMLDVIRSVGWKRIALIYDIETLGWAGREYFSARAKLMGIFILAYQPMTTAGVPFDPKYEVIKREIDSSQSRVQVLMATGKNQQDFLQEMKNSGYFGPDYAWITVNDISSSLKNDPDVEAFDGLIMVDNGWELNGYEPYEDFRSRWMSLSPVEYPGAGVPTLENNEGMAYSCVMMLANVYAELIRGAVLNPADRTPDNQLIQEILAGDHTEDIRVSEVYRHTAYRGPSGPITLDNNGDRKEGYYVASTMQDGKSVPFGIVFSGNYSFVRPPYFKDGHPSLPRDAPPWALQNPRWDNTGGIIFGTLCIVCILMTLVSALLVIIYRQDIVIKASSPTFCLCELFGILLIFVWCLLHIGAPDRGMCMSQSFLLPIGATLLAGSLTVKNYRIFRIFNSVTVSNQAFQTRLLIRYVALVVLLCMIPMIAEVIVDMPEPQVVNIRAYQWVRCRGHGRQVWWVISASIIPAILILFGVFLAFKTRNVVFLWNEARQISLVLYNVFFFTIIIAIAQFFPADIYLATFYITLVGTFFIASLSLIVLFSPKFWNIYKSRRKNWGEDHAATSGGGGGGGVGRRGGAGLGGIGGNGVGGIAVMGRLPHDLGFAGPGGAGGGRRQRQQEMTQVEPFTAETVLEPVLSRNQGQGQNSDPDSEDQGLAKSRKSGKGHTKSPSGSLSTFSKTKTEGDNPVTAWMNSKMPQKSKTGSISDTEEGFKGVRRGTFDENTATGTIVPINREAAKGVAGVRAGVGVGGVEADERGIRGEEGTGGAVSASEMEEKFSTQHQLLKMNRVGFEDTVATTDLDAAVDPFQTSLQPSVTFGSSASGAQRMLDSFMFLLPIRVLRSRIASILSHWSMATLILIPEAHAFLAVDSTDGRSTSYLMLTMTQVQNENEPTIRVTTSHAGTLLIRFATQARLEGWMDLFSEQDLQSLAPRSSSTTSSNYSNLGGLPPPAGTMDANFGIRRRSVSQDPNQEYLNHHSIYVTARKNNNHHDILTSGITPEMMDFNNATRKGNLLGGSLQGGSGGGGGGGGSNGIFGPRDTLATANALGAPGLDQTQSPEQSQKRTSWTSRLSFSSMRALWHRKDSSKSTSGASSNYFHDGDVEDDGHDGYGHLRRWSRGQGGGASGVGEWTSTDSNMATIPRRKKNQHPFMAATETVPEDREGEVESIPPKAQQLLSGSQDFDDLPDQELRAAYAIANGETLSQPELDNTIDPASLPLPKSLFLSVDPHSFNSHNTSNNNTLSTSTSPTTPSFLPSRPPEARPIISPLSETGAEDDDDDDDLYDPEFGIGGNGRRRRRRPRLPSRITTSPGSIPHHAAIPSAAVISAAAAAVSAGWSESDALAAAIANPGSMTPAYGPSSATSRTSSSGGKGSNRPRHDSRASTSSFRFSIGRSRQESVGEGQLSSSSSTFSGISGGLMNATNSGANPGGRGSVGGSNVLRN